MQLKNMSVAAVALLLWAMAYAAFGQTPDTTAAFLSSPRKTLHTFLHYQQAGSQNMVRASLPMKAATSQSREQKIELAKKLKRIFDSRGLLVEYASVPDNSTYVDSLSGNHRYMPFAQLPSVYLVRQDGQWIFSETTVAVVPRLYRETFSLFIDVVIDELPAYMHTSFMGLQIWQYLALFVWLLIGLMSRYIFEYFFENYAARLVSRTQTRWDDIFVEETRKPVSFLFMIGFYWATFSNLMLSVTINYYLSTALNVLFLSSFIWLFFNLTNVLTRYLTHITGRTESKLDDQLVPLVRKTVKVFVVVIGIIFILQNNGVNVTSLLAGLGLGGLAFALAARDSLANFFGSITIFTDQPFQVGDLIKTPHITGVVQEVGFRSTRLRTLYDSVASVPNSTLANAAIDNLGLRNYRRLDMKVSLTYDTSPRQVEAFVEGVKAIINGNEQINQSNYEVHFNEMSDDSLDVMIYFFFDVAGWSQELQQRHNFLLQLMELADQVGVEFAYPTQTLHVDQFYGEDPRIVGAERSDEELAAAVQVFSPEGRLSKPDRFSIKQDGKIIDFSPNK